MDKTIWINKEVLNWSSYIESTLYNDNKALTRAYELWQHAEELLKSEKTELHRVDAISTLKRCLNQRLQFIEKIYSFKKISLKNSPKGYLEYLETFNLVRPLMLKKLMQIRNDIEHYDKKPPELDRCNELLDLTWYFLKSTDNFLQRQPDSLVYSLEIDNKETQYWMGLDIDFELDYTIEFRGWFPPNLISKTPIENSIKCTLKEIHTKTEKWEDNLNHQDKLDTDLWICGVLNDTVELKHQIIKDLLAII